MSTCSTGTTSSPVGKFDWIQSLAANDLEAGISQSLDQNRGVRILGQMSTSSWGSSSATATGGSMLSESSPPVITSPVQVVVDRCFPNRILGHGFWRTGRLAPQPFEARATASRWARRGETCTPNADGGLAATERQMLAIHGHASRKSSLTSRPSQEEPGASDCSAAGRESESYCAARNAKAQVRQPSSSRTNKSRSLRLAQLHHRPTGRARAQDACGTLPNVHRSTFCS